MNRPSLWSRLLLLLLSTSQFTQSYIWKWATHLVTGAISLQVAVRLVAMDQHLAGGGQWSQRKSASWGSIRLKYEGTPVEWNDVQQIRV